MSMLWQTIHADLTCVPLFPGHARGMYCLSNRDASHDDMISGMKDEINRPGATAHFVLRRTNPLRMYVQTYIDMTIIMMVCHKTLSFYGYRY